MSGGSDPTIAPTKVFQEDCYFIGKYTHRYENQIEFDINQVYGANWVYAKKEATESPVPIKQPALPLMLPLGIGLFFVRTILESYSASTTWPKHYVDIAIA